MRYGLLTFAEPENDLNRKIIHIDMDAFYASVEMRDNPSFRNKPVIITPHPRKTGGRGVVTTCNYEARKFGVHSAMSSQEAFERCPHAVFVAPRMEYYREVSKQIRAVFARYTDYIEPLSLDEAYLDVTVNKKSIPSATLIAQAIQREVYQELQLTCSAGVSYNKFLAKIASDYQKPAGLTIITPEDASSFLSKLPISKFFGVGTKTAERLTQMGIHNGSDLLAYSLDTLISNFGKMGFDLYKKVRGIDNQPVISERVRKSVGKEHTYRPFLTKEDQVEDALIVLAAEVEKNLRSARLHGQVVVLKIRYEDFDTLTRQRKELTYVQTKQEIVVQALALWEEHGTLNRAVRLLGITVTSLAPQSYAPVQLPLWEPDMTE